MFCENCGMELQDNAKFCHNCGAAIEAEAVAVPVEEPVAVAEPVAAEEPVAAPEPAVAAQPAAETVAQPVPQGQPQFQQQYQQPGYQYYQPNPLSSVISTAKTFGILSIVGAFVFTIAGLILGIVGMNKVKNLEVPAELEEERRKAHKLNKIGFILSIVFMGLGIIFAILTGCLAAASGAYY